MVNDKCPIKSAGFSGWEARGKDRCVFYDLEEEECLIILLLRKMLRLNKWRKNAETYRMKLDIQS